MDTILVNFGDSKTFDSERLLLNLPEKKNKKE